MLDRIRSAAAAWVARWKVIDAAVAAWVTAHPRLTISLAALSIVAVVML